MAIGFTLIDASQAIPDKGMAMSVNPRMKISSFGDGYEQRVYDGINVLPRVFSVSFSTRPKAEIDEIKLFFEARAADAASFSFTFNNHTTGGTPVETTIEVVCDNWTESYAYDDYYSLTASFRQVYNP